ncbi:MAG TPA: glycosyltransferase family 2 protein [Acidobacteriaceae bacterium]|nr:glycosyltransferase family 2 protein [Acidobacteriaceae bacterium]
MIPDSHPAGGPDASVIIVTWNAKKYVEMCLRSLSHVDNVSFETIVVDNASTDGTPELVERDFSQVRLIPSGGNLGFAKGNNIGIHASRGRYLCLVNSDVIVPPDCLKTLVRFMDANPAVGLAGPAMLGPHGSGVRRSCMRFPSLANALVRAFALDTVGPVKSLVKSQLMTDFHHDDIADVDILNGWFWIARREAVDQVGLLDEQFFMYGEDVDWCRRFHQGGWRVVFYPAASAVHFGGASSSVAPVRFYVEQERANIQYWKKHHGPVATAAYCAIVFLHNVVRLVAYAIVSLLVSNKRRIAVAKARCSWFLLGWMSGLRRRPLRNKEA